MYANLMVATMTSAIAWRADVRDYARWEYGRDAEAWLLALRAKARRARPRRSLRGRIGRILRSVGARPNARL